MTYRRDSDIPFPYGIIKQSIAPIVVDYDEIWNAKNSNASAVWLISNCNHRTGRLTLGEALKSVGLNVRREKAVWFSAS